MRYLPLLMCVFLTLPLPAFAGFQNNFQSLQMTDEPFVANAPKKEMTPSVRQGELVDSWRGRKGESINNVVKRWSVRAGYDLIWDTKKSATLKADFTTFGTFEEAVSVLFRTHGLQGTHSEIRPQGLTYSSEASAQPVNLSPQIGPLPQEPFGKVQRWRGLRGANLKEVFEVWAEDAGVKLIWAVSDQLALQSSINETASFSDIISQSLEQYENLPERPVARLYTGGDPTLVVAPEGAGL